MKIGTHIDILNPLCLAPMEDVSDAAFRQICKDLGADIVFTEFTSAEAISRGIDKTLKKMIFAKKERPIGVQIYGARESSLIKAVELVDKYNPDFIDINCGCWVKNHVNQNQCAALLKDLPKMEKLVKAVVQATSTPVTVKTRLGWDSRNIVILDAAKMLEQIGVQCLTVHCRTRNQAYKGAADWSWLSKIKKVISIPLIGNGDIFDPLDVQRMFETGCDGVMIGRGAIGNPWIFQQAKHYLKTKQLPEPPTLEQKIALCLKHLKLAVKLKGERNGILPFRKYYAGYLKGIPGVAKLRADLMMMNYCHEIEDRLSTFVKSH